jgi:hypothetical protein
MGQAKMAQYFDTRYMPNLTRPPHKRNHRRSLLIAGATSFFLHFGWTQPLSICSTAWYRTFPFYFLVISWTSRIVQCNASSLHTSEPFSMRQLTPATVWAHRWCGMVLMVFHRPVGNPKRKVWWVQQQAFPLERNQGMSNPGKSQTQEGDAC